MYDIISKLQDLFFFLSRMFVFRWTKLGLDELERRSNYYSILNILAKSAVPEPCVTVVLSPLSDNKRQPMRSCGLRAEFYTLYLKYKKR